MSGDLLDFFNRELGHLRNAAAEFAQNNPDVARGLKISEDYIEDPHVSRLLDGVAYLNARIWQKLEDDFPELSETLLDLVFPHFSRPVPSVAIAQILPDPQLDSTRRVPRGAQLRTAPIDGEPCIYQSRYDIDLMPVSCKACRLNLRPFSFPGQADYLKAQAVIELVLQCDSKETSFADLKPESLRFFLRGQGQYIHELQSRLLANRREGRSLFGYVCSPDGKAAGTRLDPGGVTPVGLHAQEALLEYPAQSNAAYRHLTEYFICPEKYQFVDIDLRGVDWSAYSGELHLFLYIEDASPELQRNVDEDTFALGCTPIINLFDRRADPINMNGRQSEYLVVPDARRMDAIEVFSIESVEAQERGRPEREVVLPFNGVNHDPARTWQGKFWHQHRRPRGDNDGTEVFVSLTDIDASRDFSQSMLLLNTRCVNRNVPSRLPKGSGQPYLTFDDQATPAERIICLTPPSPTRRPKLGKDARWKLVSHLNVSHQSLSGGSDAAAILREIVELYDISNRPEMRAIPRAIKEISTRTIVAPVTVEGERIVCRGIDIEVILEPNAMAGHSTFVFGSVLDSFFGLLASMNAFTRTSVTNPETNDTLVWPIRSGSMELV